MAGGLPKRLDYDRRRLSNAIGNSDRNRLTSPINYATRFPNSWTLKPFNVETGANKHDSAGDGAEGSLL